MQVCSHSRFALPLPLQWYTTSPTWKSSRAGSVPCARDLASTARDKARSYLNEVIDLCAADIIAMRSENALSRVTLVQQRVRQSQSSSEVPLRWRVLTVIDGRIASPNDRGSEQQTRRSTVLRVFSRLHRAVHNCVLLWSGDGCRHEFTTHVFELLSELALDFS